MPVVDTSKKFDSVAIYRIRKLLADLSNKTGRGTELVSLYLPPKKAIHEAIAALREESGTASNIKSDVTRSHVQDALTKTMARLRLYKQTPENGLVIFCGAIPGPGGPGNETIELFEVLPQKPVTVYLYRCLAPDTLVLLDNGLQRPIRELNRQEPISVASLDSNKISSAPVKRHIETIAGDRKVFRLKVESGRSIIATEDHPIFTPRGWVNAGDLKPDDLTCIKPTLEDVSCNSRSEDAIIVSESDVREMSFAPSNIELTVRRLKQRGLLPLRQSNPKLFLLSRLLGHLFSDGSLTHNLEVRNGKPYSHFTADFCVGDESDIREIKLDLQSLGVEPQKSYKSVRIIEKDGRSYSTTTLHLKVRDTALCTLLRALDAPIGGKVKSCPPLPEWLFKSSPLVQREFLASYMGGDGEAPRILKSNPCSAMRLTFHRIEMKRQEAMNFARDLESLFSNFGVLINDVSCSPSYLRKDGLPTLEFELRFKLTQENVLKVCQTIGYRYCKRKSIQSQYVGEYLRIRSSLYTLLQSKMTIAKEMSTNGATMLQISNALDISQSSAKQWAKGIVSSPIIRSTMLAEYEDWLKISIKNLHDGMVWESITSKEEVQLDRVMDLTVGNESHSFFANGFLVHNCDDHFHLDPLKEMLREQDVIGVISMDATEAGFGIVSGDSWEVVDTMSSGVSGKTRKGGQCVSRDTLVQLENGKLVPISKLDQNTKIASYDFTNYKSEFHECADNYSMIPKEYYEISTARPQMRIRATSEHRFFTVDRNGVTTKQAYQLKIGDRVLVTRKLPAVLEPDLRTRFPADFVHQVDKEGRALLKELRIRKHLSQPSLANILGLHQSEISQLERGERNLVWEKLQKVVTYLVDKPQEFNSIHVATSRILPEYFAAELLQLLGYIAGDGGATGNRIALWEQRRDVADLYSKLTQECLGLKYVPINSKDRTHNSKTWSKNIYFETRIYSQPFVQALKMHYSGLISVDQREIPEQFHRLDNGHLAHFVRGLFDAEGFVRPSRIGLAMKSGLLIRQLQLLLLRFGIVSSYSRYTTRFGTVMHNLDISDLDSIIIFSREIGFSAEDKKMRLALAASRPRAQSYLNVPLMGSWVDGIAKTLGIRRKQFKGISNYFQDQRGISSPILMRILATFEEEIASGASRSSSQQTLLKETAQKLEMLVSSQLVLACISKIDIKKNAMNEQFFDIELPETKSFLGNGFVLHNSARRYERLREMELTDYFNRLADHAKKAFLESYQIKGLIVGGPGPTKDEFVKDKYLDYRLQNLIVGILDSGYAGREGVRETIEKSGKLLENVRVVEEKKLVQRFFREVNSDSGLAIYGVKDILAALKKAAVDTILINDDVDTLYLKMICDKCQNVVEKYVPRSQVVSEKQSMLACPKCGSNEVEISERDIVDFLADAALDSGANVEVISSKTEDGAMLKNFGGISAILRYRV